MFRVIDKDRITGGALLGEDFKPQETIILDEDLGEVRFIGPVSVRNIIVHKNVTLIFEGPVEMNKNALGAAIFMAGVKAHSLNATGNVIVKGKVELGAGRSVVENGNLLVRGDLHSAGDVVVHGCCRVTGEVSGDGVMACDDIWAPFINALSRSKAQRLAEEEMSFLISDEKRPSIISRLFSRN